MPISNAIYFVSNFVFAYGMHVFYKKFFLTEEKKWVLRMALLSFVFVDFILYLCISNSYVFPVTSLLTFFVLSLAYQRKVNYKNFLAAFWILVFGICGELLASYLVSFFMEGMGYVNSDNALIAALVSARLIFFFLTLMAARLFCHQRKGEPMRYVSLLTMMLPVISIGLVIYVFGLAEFDQNTILSAGSVGAILSVLAIVWINLITVWLFDRSSYIYQTEQEAQALRKTVQIQQEHYNGEMKKREELRKLRHDYKNILLAIQADLTEGREKEARKVLERELKNEVFSGSSQSGWYALDAIVNYKETKAQKYDIVFISDYYFEAMPQMSSEDVCVMMGNALDNAMEYLALHPKCSRKVKIHVRYEKGVLNIKIGNQVESAVAVKDRRFCDSSKTEEGHGYGLKSIDYIAGKYGGRLILSGNEHYFECGMILYC